MDNSRTRKTKKNIIAGLINKFIFMLFPFIIRTVILYYLSEEYLGLTSLFSSILQVLNLAELGFSSAIVYSMYKPIAENNYNEVGAYLNCYKKIYTVIGCIVFALGIIILPFITYFINGSWPSEINIYFLYFLYLLDSSISYFLFAYKSSLLNVLQKMNVVSNIQSIIWIFKYILQIIIIIVLKNYYLFVAISIFSTISINIVTSIYVDGHYKKYFNKEEINSVQKKEIKKQVSGVMICKISDVTRNSFDSIILSMFLGLTTVAAYNNYYYIFSAVYAIMLIITNSMQASIGNSIAKEKVLKNYNDILKFNYIFCFIITFCVISMIFLYQPFMKIWINNNPKLILSDLNMMLLCLYFWVLNINNVKNLYFEGNGLWWKAKFYFILESLGNLILNIILGKMFGITGIIIATIITIFIFNYIIRTNIVFKEYFKRSPFEFYKNTLFYFLVCVILATFGYIICNKILLINGISGIFMYIVISGVLSLLFNLPFIKTNEFKDSVLLIKKILKLK